MYNVDESYARHSLVGTAHISRLDSLAMKAFASHMARRWSVDSLCWNGPAHLRLSLSLEAVTSRVSHGMDMEGLWLGVVLVSDRDWSSPGAYELDWKGM